MRVMALDVGDRNIGLAVSDETGTIAMGLGVIKRTSIAEDIKKLKAIIEENDIKKIVVGMPVNMNGSIGFQGKKVMNFIDELKDDFKIPIVTWDERLTTVIAEKALIQADISRKKRKGLIDKMSAVVILQNYLDCQKIVD
ncbi:MAG TPA: Holliday junction resolvase RuvX [Thermoanaerobacterales bacterium]|nr:Holliday junction resolvase RuvX [Thermoanaerobacterales bacterium]